MGKRELSGAPDLKPEPTLVLSKDKKPVLGTFRGEYLGLKNDKAVGAFANKYIHRFAFISGTLPIELKQGDKYVSVALDKGDELIVFANPPMHTALLKAEVGMTLDIDSNGEKLNPKTKRYYHDHVVSVVE